VSTPDLRRLALGDQLRLLRESARTSGKELAEQLHWQASKISKIERGRQTVTDSDIVAISAALGLSAETTEALRDEGRAIRLDEAKWRGRLQREGGHQTIQQAVSVAEGDARVIRGFSLGLLPGLVQTAEYARTVFTTLAELYESPRDIDAAVAARLDRQHVLYDSQKQIELLMTETALRHPLAPRAVMLAQLDRLLTVQGLPALRLGIVPANRPLGTVVQHSFSIKDDIVTVELAHTEVATREPADIELYNRLADRLWSVAVEGEQARALLTSVAADLG
jgi:transcriptional regulator with XRE-family HTH domain